MAAEKKQDVVQAVQKILNDPDNEIQLEKITEEIISQINSDSESYRQKGYQIVKAFLENQEAADFLLMALCGWSMKSLLVFAGLIPDTDGLITH